jgi:hypothetical protein
MGAKSALMTDGYAVYDQIAQAHQLVHLACWAHCRRDFNDALQALPKNARTVDQLAAQFMALIAQLYAVEAKARERELGVQELLEQRQLHSVPVLQKIEALLLANIHAVLPGSLLGTECVNDFATPCVINLLCRDVLFLSHSFAQAEG